MLKILFWLKLDFTKDLPLKLHYFLSQKKKEVILLSTKYQTKLKPKVLWLLVVHVPPIPSKEVDAWELKYLHSICGKFWLMG